MTVKDLLKIFGNNLRQFRTQNRWTQQILSDETDLSINTISEIETAKKFVHADKLVLLANTLNIDVYKFFIPPGLDPEPEPDVLKRFHEEAKEKIDQIYEDLKNNLSGSEKPESQ